MTAASTLAFPPSKLLAGWWRHLAPYKPNSVWIAHLLLHRVEAQVVAQQPLPVDSLDLFVLKALAITPDATVAAIAQSLDLPAGFVRQVFNKLATDDLVREDRNGSWTITKTGAQSARSGIHTRAQLERRPFYFVEPEDGTRPQFLHLMNHPAMTDWHTRDGWRFDVSVLHHCLAQPRQWKQQHGFPDDVVRVMSLASEQRPAPAARPDWQSVILDQPKSLAAVVVKVSHQPGEALLGFAIEQEPLALRSETPAFQLPAPWQQVFPSLATDASLDQWRQAWAEWCRPRGLLMPEMENCPLERHGCKLRVMLGSQSLDKLRSMHGEALHGEVWLLAGSGRTRAAAAVQIVETK